MSWSLKNLHMLAKLGLMFAMAGPVVANSVEQAPVQVKGLRGVAPLDQVNPPGRYRQERDHGPADRDFVQQPPLIPHSVQGYQITANFNKCMDCHAWQKAKSSGATKVGVSHYRTRDGQELDSEIGRAHV